MKNKRSDHAAPMGQMPGTEHRLIMAGLGGIAGLALWGLGDRWGDPSVPPALFLALFTFVATYSIVALALSGPVAVARALIGALGFAVFLTLLVSIAGMRYMVTTDLLDEPVMVSVAAVIVLFCTPFLLVWLQDRSALLRYDRLFDAAWMLTARYALAWVFVAAFWLIAFLSDALLELVDIEVIDSFLRPGWVRFGLSGAVLGLGLAVVQELRHTLSPYPLLRLLRLLVPLVLVVVSVFLLAVPLRGLDRLFGEFSAGGTLLGAAAVAVSLISMALDRDDRMAVQTRGLRSATQVLAVLMPLLTALTVWAVITRVRQYGWTPDRIMAMTVALFLLTYGMAYCGAVLLRGGWMSRIRQINVAMAVLVIAVAGLWMTPVLDVYRISTASQVSRFETGRTTMDQLALWPLAHEWGRAGKSGLAALQSTADTSDSTGLIQRIVAVREATNRYQFEQQVQHRDLPERAAELLELLPIRPAGAVLDAETLQDIPVFALNMWLNGCRHVTADGRPGCVLVKGAFVPSVSADEQAMILFLDDDADTRISHVVLRPDDGFVMRDVFDPATRAWPSLPAATISEIQDGAFDLRPSGVNALSVGGKLLAPSQ
ncbi:DUF4153 domain-containing protein [Sedimentitalea todarodis]|uniref:DUF4153 domain-containing protein n=1 Tax=Sedimentitalea todarodis TaxID=1631240 RepID=A0ABU3VBE5_9RHOB|nr:hypothetical protein [Sedimentitalea todarodis]MDU9003388.1 DUF4153 domain-containing protein [Sedimentitalea todarodis]